MTEAWEHGYSSEPQHVPLRDLHGLASMNHPGLTIGEVWQYHHPEDEPSKRYEDEGATEAAGEQESLRSYVEHNGHIPGALIACSHGQALEDGEHRYMAARDARLDTVPVVRARGCLMPELHQFSKLAYAPRGVLSHIRDLAMAGTIAVTAAAGGYLRNPYHGNPEMGGREDWSHTWFHGTTGHEAPAFGEAKPGSEAEKRPGSSWEQPNKYLGVHVTPLRSVAQKFAHGVHASRIGEGSPGVPSAIVHMRLRMSSPKHFPTERGMDLDIARYASEHHPGWHDDKLNGSLGWNYSDQEGTHRDWHAPAEGADAERLGRQAQQVLQHHPRLPEIMRGYVGHLHRSGFDGITYGNEVEGPGDWHRGAQSISAIATHPSQIETTRVEHIAPPNFGRPGDPPPEPHQITHAASEAASEPEDMLGRVAAFHAAHGGKLPCKLAAAEPVTAAGGRGWWKLYHGTNRDFSAGATIDPGHGRPGSTYTGPDVYASDELRKAIDYAHAASQESGGHPVVYQVEPTTAVTPAREENAWQSGDPLRVVGEAWRHEPGKCDRWGCHVAAREEAAENPPCRYCDEPLEDEDVRDGQSAHEECEDMRWCHACEEHHDDPQETDNHNETYTDWGNHLPFEGGIHRGITVRLPGHVHAVVHDEARPAAERAAALARHLRENPADRSDERGHAGGYGVHWTDHEPIARAWGTGEGAIFGPSQDQRSGRDHTHVVMHAASPDEEHIETDPRVLDEGNLLGFDHARSEREIPLRSEAPVRLTGLSWKRADHGEWSRHDFAGPSARLAVREAAWEDPEGDTDRYVTCGQGHEHEAQEILLLPEPLRTQEAKDFLRCPCSGHAPPGLIEKIREIAASTLDQSAA